MQSPDMPAPMIATFSERFCAILTTLVPAHEWPNSTPTRASILTFLHSFAVTPGRVRIAASQTVYVRTHQLTE